MNCLLQVVLFVLFAIQYSYQLDEPFIKYLHDSRGNYQFYYAVGDVTHTEVGKRGLKQGFYEYTDANGEVQRVDYNAGPRGYSAQGTNIPVPVTDTPEVKSARKAHLLFRKGVLETAPGTPDFFLREADTSRQSK